MTVVIIQARMSSTRLPGKVLMPIMGKPLLEYQIERVKQSKQLSDLVVATSEQAADEPIVKFCHDRNIKVFRGHLTDVLSRYYQCWKCLFDNADHIVRLTADCPLIDPTIMDEVISFALNAGYDYASNTLHPTFPDGLDVEVFTAKALETAFLAAKLKSEREHVTPYLYNHTELFELGSYEADADHSAYRWTVDTREDLSLVNEIFKALYPIKKTFTMWDVIEHLDKHPHLLQINNMLERNYAIEDNNA